MKDTLPGFTVIVADGDAFESGYISSSLQASGATVLGPVQTVSAVLALLEGTTPDAVVLSNCLADGPTTALRRLLEKNNIAHLPLIGPAPDEAADLFDVAVLRKPFAAYQVVQWAAQWRPAAAPI